MSWSFTGTSKRAGIKSALQNEHERYAQTQQGYGYPLSEEANEQIDAAISVAATLAKAVATSDHNLNVTLSGHAEPGHNPVSGQASEFIQIHVTST